MFSFESLYGSGRVNSVLRVVSCEKYVFCRMCLFGC